MTDKSLYADWSGRKGTIAGYFLNSPIRTVAEIFTFGNARKNILTLLEEHLPEESSMADFGSGSGYYSIAAAKKFPHATVTAVDLSGEMLTVQHRKALAAGVRERIILVERPAEKTEIESSSMDAVISISFMHEVPDPFEVFGEMTRILKPGGILIISDFKKSPSGHHGDNSHGPLTEEEYRELYNKLGFSDAAFANGNMHLFHHGIKQ